MKTSRADATWRAALRLAIRLALVILIIAWIVREAGWREIVATIQRADPIFLLLGLLGLTLEMLAKAWNWARLLDSLGCSTLGQRLQLLRAYLVAALMGTLLPSSASTDALRIVIAQRLFGGRPSMHAACIVVQNVLGWVSACALGLACIGILVAQGRAPSYALPAALVSGFVVVTGAALHLGLKRYRWLLLLTLRRVARRHWFALRRAARRFINALLVFERAHVRFVPRALVATAAAFFSASAFQAVGLAVGVDLPPQVWCAIVPLFSLFGLLPISVSGFGGAQAVHVFLLAPFAVAAPKAFAVSALYAVLNIVLNVVFGAAAWMLGSNEISKRTIATEAAPDG
jgi:uncharacterized protein (TIRG00374 family)